MSHAAYLATLDRAQLTALLQQRPDVLVEPVPRTVAELAMRLDGVDSVSRALELLDRDAVVVAQAAALVDEPTPEALAHRLGAPEGLVRSAIDRMRAKGLAWEVGGRVGLPPRWEEALADVLARFRPVAVIAHQARAEHLATAVAGLGGEPLGLRKPELVTRLEELSGDPEVVVRAVGGLPGRARRYLDDMRLGAFVYLGFQADNRGANADLVRAGVLVDGPSHVPELSREMAGTLLLRGLDELVGDPGLPVAAAAPGDGRAGAEAALRALTTLLDEAGNRPLAALKKGGVGTRERARIGRLGVPAPALWIDVAFGAGLLAKTPDDDYAPTAALDGWRDEDPGVRWARVALAWFALGVAPTRREVDGSEVPPPVPFASHGGLVRRALLRACAGWHPVPAVVELLGWFCPLAQHDQDGLSGMAAAALREAEQLGIVEGDRLTALGEHLVAVADGPDAEEELARRAAELLPATAGQLVLQSDLTAVASGQLSAASTRLLAGTAVMESRGTATIWRFTPDSVRGALDVGWTADELRTELTAASDRPLPQPLDYLIGDVARRHGSVRVRNVRSCVTGAEAEISEILHTRSLRSLKLSRLAPTVLASSRAAKDLLPALRAAGFAPMQEDAGGVVTVPVRQRAPWPEAVQARVRARVSAGDLAARLGDGAGAAQASATESELTGLAPQLDAAEVALLADALDHRRDVRIGYRNSAGNYSVREIRPEKLYGRWIMSWCHLRRAQREFTVANIETVGPVG